MCPTPTPSPRTRRRAIDLALSAVPGTVVERLTAVSAPLARHSGRTRTGSAALASALRALTRPPAPRLRSNRPATLEVIADEVGRPPEDVERWAESGLLGQAPQDGLWDRAAVDRAALLAFAAHQGASDEDLLQAVREERLPLLALERVLAAHPSLTGSEVAEQAGIPVELAASLWRALGFPSDDLESPLFSRREVEAMRVVGATRSVFSDQDLVEMNTVIGRAMSEIAAAAVELFRRRVTTSFAEAGVPELEASLRLAALVDLLVPPLGPVLEVVLRRHLVAATQAEAAVQIEAAGAPVPERELSVAFADMVGFTSVSEGMTPLQVAQLATRLLRAAESALAPHGARIVKSIGDAVMFTARNPVTCCAAAVDLVATAVSDHLPPVRVGVAHGPVMRAYADYFGRTVNIASRLCARAPSGTVLLHAPEQIVDGAVWARAGLSAGAPQALTLKGVDRRLRVVRVTAREPASR